MKRGPKPKNFCTKGHEFTPHNAYIAPGGKRYCRVCREVYLKVHKEEIKKWLAEWYIKNRDEVLLNSEIYRKSHPEAEKAKKAKYRSGKTMAGGSFTAMQFIALCRKCHNKCLRCKRHPKLEADHVIPVSKGGTSNIENIQPLCRSCNARKGTKTTDYRT